MHSVSEKVDTGCTKEEAIRFCKELGTKDQIRQIKKLASAEKFPKGANFDAVGEYRKVTRQMDEYVIFKAHNSNLDDSNASYCMKSSKLKVQLLWEMDMDRDPDYDGDLCCE